MKKLLSVLLALAAALALSVTVCASAYEGLELTLEADKQSYGSGEDIIITLTAENNGYMDINGLTLTHIQPENLPKGYKLADKDSQSVTLDLLKGSRTALKAVYSKSTVSLPIIIVTVAIVGIIVIAAVAVKVSKKGKNAGAALVCLAVLLTSLAPSLTALAEEKSTDELSCTVNFDGQEIIFKAEATYMQPVDNSPEVVLATSSEAAPIYIDSDGGAYDGLSLVAEAVMFQTVYNFPNGFNSTGEFILITAG